MQNINQIKPLSLTVCRLQWFHWFHIGSTFGSTFYSMKSTWFHWFHILPQLSHVCVRVCASARENKFK